MQHLLSLYIGVKLHIDLWEVCVCVILLAVTLYEGILIYPPNTLTLSCQNMLDKCGAQQLGSLSLHLLNHLLPKPRQKTCVLWFPTSNLARVLF